MVMIKRLFFILLLNNFLLYSNIQAGFFGFLKRAFSKSDVSRLNKESDADYIKIYKEIKKNPVALKEFINVIDNYPYLVDKDVYYDSASWFVKHRSKWDNFGEFLENYLKDAADLSENDLKNFYLFLDQYHKNDDLVILFWVYVSRCMEATVKEKGLKDLYLKGEDIITKMRRTVAKYLEATRLASTILALVD